MYVYRRSPCIENVDGFQSYMLLFHSTERTKGTFRVKKMTSNHMGEETALC